MAMTVARIIELEDSSNPPDVRELAAEVVRLRDALYEIACGKTTWEREDMIDVAEAAIRESAA